MNDKHAARTRRFCFERNGRGGFTLVELLVVLGIIGLLAALVMTGVSRAKAKAQRIACLNHLSQIGKAMTMYLGDNNKYPLAMGGGPPFQTWADRLGKYSTTSWTNVEWNCPTYIAEGGVVRWSPLPPEGGKFEAWMSYAYNSDGMSGTKWAGGKGFQKGPRLGLGNLNRTVQEQQVVASSEMYAAGDARPQMDPQTHKFTGRPVMYPWKLGFGFVKIEEAPAPHDEGYNLLYVDGHVNLVERKDYLYPPRSARNWNRDNQPHPELWPVKSEWAVTN